MSDKSVIWSTQVDIDSFQSVKKKGRAQKFQNLDLVSIGSPNQSKGSSIRFSQIQLDLPTTIQITNILAPPSPMENEKSLTIQGYSTMKLNTIAELEETTT